MEHHRGSLTQPASHSHSAPRGMRSFIGLAELPPATAAVQIHVAQSVPRPAAGTVAAAAPLDCWSSTWFLSVVWSYLRDETNSGDAVRVSILCRRTYRLLGGDAWILTIREIMHHGFDELEAIFDHHGARMPGLPLTEAMTPLAAQLQRLLT